MNQTSESLTDEISAQAAELERQVVGIEAEAAPIKAGKAETADRRRQLTADEANLGQRKTALDEREKKIATGESELKKKEAEFASERWTASNMRTAGGVALVAGVLAVIGAAYWASSRQKTAEQIVQTTPSQQPAAETTKLPPEVVVKVPDKVVVVVEGPKAEAEKMGAVTPHPPPTVAEGEWKSGPGLKLKCAWTVATKKVDCEGAEQEEVRNDNSGSFFAVKVSGMRVLSYYIPEQVLQHDFKEDLSFGTLLLDCGVRYVWGDTYAPYCMADGKPAAPSEFVLPSAQPAPPLAQGVAVQKLQGVNFAWFAEFERKKGKELCPVAFYAG